MKAQISGEFLVVLAILLMIFLILFIVYNGQNLTLSHDQDSVSAAINAYSVAATIDYIYVAGDGAQFNLTFPLLPSDNMTLSSSSVQDARNNVAEQAPIIVGKLNATAVRNGQPKIGNSNGVVSIG